MAKVSPADFDMYGITPEAAELIIGDEEMYARRNPAGGEELVMRPRHNRIRSKRLAAQLECVSEFLRGRRYRGHGPAEDERDVREALSQASKKCSRITRAISNAPE